MPLSAPATLIRKPAYTTFMPRRTTIFTDEELAHARGRQDAWDVLQTKDREEIGNGDEVVLHPREEWVLHQHRDAYLDGAAAVLGYKPHLVI